MTNPIRSSLIPRMFTKLRHHLPKRKLDRAVSGVWMGRHDQTALTSGRGKKQRWSGCASSFEPMNTEIYCDACIIILWVTIIIHHVYKPDFCSLRSFFPDRKLWPVCHEISSRVRSSFLLGQCAPPLWLLLQANLNGLYHLTVGYVLSLEGTYWFLRYH